jgi:hypothetical protein
MTREDMTPQQDQLVFLSSAQTRKQERKCESMEPRMLALVAWLQTLPLLAVPCCLCASRRRTGRLLGDPLLTGVATLSLLLAVGLFLWAP